MESDHSTITRIMEMARSEQQEDQESESDFVEDPVDPGEKEKDEAQPDQDINQRKRRPTEPAEPPPIPNAQIIHDRKQTNKLAVYHLESRWRNSNVLVYHGPSLSHLLRIAPYTFTTV